jgi:hypothetical protein
MTDTIAPEIGKFYRTRDGYCCGPMERGSMDGDLLGWILGAGGRRYYLDGRHFYGNASLDLVAEWTNADDADEVVHNRIVDEFTDSEQAASARWPEETSEAQTLVDAQYADQVTEVQLDGVSWGKIANGTSVEKPSTAYIVMRTQVPPVLEIENGRLVIKLVHENLTLIAEVGDGRFFFSQVIAKLVDPALLAAHKTAQFVREYAAPND